jgi:hypothetical protein
MRVGGHFAAPFSDKTFETSPRVASAAPGVDPKALVEYVG